jgi:hypothetical protein
MKHCPACIPVPSTPASVPLSPELLTDEFLTDVLSGESCKHIPENKSCGYVLNESSDCLECQVNQIQAQLLKCHQSDFPFPKAVPSELQMPKRECRDCWQEKSGVAKLQKGESQEAHS